jgi:hypothetical protein
MNSTLTTFLLLATAACAPARVLGRSTARHVVDPATVVAVARFTRADIIDTSALSKWQGWRAPDYEALLTLEPKLRFGAAFQPFQCGDDGRSPCVVLQVTHSEDIGPNIARVFARWTKVIRCGGVSGDLIVIKAPAPAKVVSEIPIGFADCGTEGSVDSRVERIEARQP